jgi:hypothetical protein
MALVEPKSPTAPKQSAAADKNRDGIPDEILELPAFQALFAGAPPAVSASIDALSKRPEGELLAKHKDSLMKAGLNLYRSLSGDLGVIFNQLYIAPEDIQAADKAGRLTEIAPPFDAVTEQISKSGDGNPVLSAKGPTGGFPTPTPQTPPQGAAMPAPANAQQARMAQQRAESLTPKAPTKRPAPGAGKLTNAILKPVI